MIEATPRHLDIAFQLHTTLPALNQRNQVVREAVSPHMAQIML